MLYAVALCGRAQWVVFGISVEAGPAMYVSSAVTTTALTFLPNDLLHNEFQPCMRA